MYNRPTSFLLFFLLTALIVIFCNCSDRNKTDRYFTDYTNTQLEQSLQASHNATFVQYKILENRSTEPMFMQVIKPLFLKAVKTRSASDSLFNYLQRALETLTNGQRWRNAEELAQHIRAYITALYEVDPSVDQILLNDKFFLPADLKDIELPVSRASTDQLITFLYSLQFQIRVNENRIISCYNSNYCAIPIQYDQQPSKK